MELGQSDPAPDGRGTTTRTATSTSVTDGDNHTTSYSYDAAGEQTAVTRPDGRTLRTGYWPDGRCTSSFDGNEPADLPTATTRSGRLISVTDPLGRTTCYGYDLAGQLITKTDSPAGSPPTATTPPVS